MTDVKNAYETLLNNRDIVQLYDHDYLNQAKQSLEIAQFAYQHGAASLLDFLDAERTYRSTELSYRQALASYMTRAGTTAASSGNAGTAVESCESRSGLTMAVEVRST